MTGAVLLLGATGTIGRATAKALRRQGRTVVAPVRRAEPGLGGTIVSDFTAETLTGLMQREKVDAVVSCIASRTGIAKEAWAVDYGINARTLAAADAAGVRRFVLLSAICVQRPRLAFQKAKAAFEAELRAGPLDWTIVRPTAFFKSISGQAERVRQGKPYLLFGDGALTACKPISDRDLAHYLATSLDQPDAVGQILPIGGPGPALTPRQQGELMFEAFGLAPRFRHVPPGLIRGIGAVLALGGRMNAQLAVKAELARIGHYYATESMLVWDEGAGRYDADATPETGSDRLADHFAALARGEVGDDRGTHAVF